MSIRYIINEENKTVTAIMEKTAKDAINAANSWTGWNSWRYGGAITTCVSNQSKYLMPNKFVAVARCSDGDTWDENTGVKIAQQRVLYKYHKSFNKAVRKINADIKAEADRFNARVMKLRDEK